MKHQSSRIYSLTWPAKTARDRIWRAVLVGRYPRGFKLLFESSIRGASRSVHFKTNKIGGLWLAITIEKLAICWNIRVSSSTLSLSKGKNLEVRTISRKLQYLKEVQMKHKRKNKKNHSRISNKKCLSDQERARRELAMMEGRGGIPDGLDSGR